MRASLLIGSGENGSGGGMGGRWVPLCVYGFGRGFWLRALIFVLCTFFPL
jgi:hypothetical protein